MVKQYLLNNLPDFSINLNSLKKMEDFRTAADDQDINRVILFSKKAKTPPVFKVLTGLFRDRLRFGFVSAEQQPEVVAAFSEHISPDKLPSILVLKSFDTVSGKVLETLETIKYDKKE